MATVVAQVGQGHYYIDYGGRIFKQAAEQLRHVSERERLALEAVRESEEPADAHAPEEDDERGQIIIIGPRRTIRRRRRARLCGQAPKPDHWQEGTER